MRDGQMIISCMGVQRFEFFVRALAALDPGFLTGARNPFIFAGHGIAGTATGTRPADRIDILSAAKELPEQFSFLIRFQLRYCGLLRSAMKLVPPGK